ncbi:IST1 homolog [Sycon ciliatum]|uniref:IST1 homolog n=1 Tax=Sycon ciliatum TaxID=27933 RepID=UPI0020AA376B|eukprot:scpid53007/ scgid25420/ IST1 homolog; Putative MAPK-activating protein PM28
MFGGGYKSSKLRVNLRLAINRLKLLQKKKTEQAVKARKEIAEYLQLCKVERARIRVEHIIREDYMVEAMEVLEMYCDLLLARFGLIETMKYCDEGLTEAVCTLIWVAPRLQSDIAEMKLIADQLTLKYGKTFGEQSRANSNGAVNDRVIHRMGSQAPPRALVEGYLQEIAQTHHIEFTPDEDALREGTLAMPSEKAAALFPYESAIGGPDVPHDPPPPFNGGGRGGGNGGGGGGGMPMPQQHHMPQQPQHMPPAHTHVAMPPPAAAAAPGPYPTSTPYVAPPGAAAPTTSPPPAAPMGHSSSPWAVAPQTGPTSAAGRSAEPPYPPAGKGQAPYPSDGPGEPRYVSHPGGPVIGGAGPGPSAPTFPDLPSVPQDSLPDVGAGSSAGPDDLDFDDLTRRFEDLKRKK